MAIKESPVAKALMVSTALSAAAGCEDNSYFALHDLVEVQTVSQMVLDKIAVVATPDECVGGVDDDKKMRGVTHEAAITNSGEDYVAAGVKNKCFQNGGGSSKPVPFSESRVECTKPGLIGSSFKEAGEARIAGEVTRGVHCGYETKFDWGGTNDPYFLRRDANGIMAATTKAKNGEVIRKKRLCW